MFPDLTRDDVFRLETRRLWLRWPQASDADAVTRGAGQKAVADMTAAIPHPFGREMADRFVREARSANGEGRALILAVTGKARPREAIGIVSIEIVAIEPDRAGGVEPRLGFWLHPDHWDKGLATEAARALVDAFFSYADGRELVAAARVINPASRRVLENSGFAHTGSGLRPFPARGGVLPVDTFRLDRRRWESMKAWRYAGYAPIPPGDGQMECAVAH